MKRLLLKNCGVNEYLFSFFDYDPICFFSKNVQIAFLNFEGHFHKIMKFQTSHFSEFADPHCLH